MAVYRVGRRPRPRQLTSGELASMSGISKRSVVKAIAAGRIRASTTAGGHYRISLAEARRFMNGRGVDTSDLNTREDCVLVVARDRFVGDLLVDVLGSAGNELFQSECLFEAGVLAAKYRPRLLILDTAAAGNDPAAVCRRVTRTDCCRQTSILVLASGDERERQALIRAGAHAVLAKPFSVKQLKSVLPDLGFSTGNYGRVGR